MVPDPNALGWRSLFGAWYVQDTIRLRRNLTLNLGLRHEFTNGWNEESGRAANYITDANGVLETAPRISSSVFTKNNATKLFSSESRPRMGSFRERQDLVRAGFGIYYSLIDDLSFLLNALPPANGSASFSGPLLPLIPVTPGVQPPPSCGPGRTNTVHNLCASGRSAGRLYAGGGGMECAGGTTTDFEHRASSGLRRFPWLSRLCQH